MLRKDTIKQLLELGFEFKQSEDCMDYDKYVLSLDATDFIDNIFNKYSIDVDYSIICLDPFYNNDGTIEIELSDREVEYLKVKEKEKMLEELLEKLNKGFTIEGTTTSGSLEDLTPIELKVGGEMEFSFDYKGYHYEVEGTITNKTKL